MYRQHRLADYSKHSVHPDITTASSAKADGIKRGAHPHWHFRMSHGFDGKKPVQNQVSINAHAHPELIGKLDEFVKKHGMGYKVPAAAEGWSGRHNPVSLYSNHEMTAEQKQELASVVGQHIRDDQGLHGEKIARGISLNKSPSKEEVNSLYERLAKNNPAEAESLRQWGGDNPSPGMWHTLQQLADKYDPQDSFDEALQDAGDDTPDMREGKDVLRDTSGATATTPTDPRANKDLDDFFADETPPAKQPAQGQPSQPLDIRKNDLLDEAMGMESNKPSPPPAKQPQQSPPPKKAAPEIPLMGDTGHEDTHPELRGMDAFKRAPRQFKEDLQDIHAKHLGKSAKQLEQAVAKQDVDERTASNLSPMDRLYHRSKSNLLREMHGMAKRREGQASIAREREAEQRRQQQEQVKAQAKAESEAKIKAKQEAEVPDPRRGLKGRVHPDLVKTDAFKTAPQEHVEHLNHIHKNNHGRPAKALLESAKRQDEQVALAQKMGDPQQLSKQKAAANLLWEMHGNARRNEDRAAMDRELAKGKKPAPAAPAANLPPEDIATANARRDAAMKRLERFKNRKNNRVASNKIRKIVRDAGGINPTEFQRLGFGNAKEDLNEGGLASLKRHDQKVPFDELAEDLERQGYFRTPPHQHATDRLLELLQQDADHDLADNEKENDYSHEQYMMDLYERSKYEFEQEREAARESGEHESSIAEAVRRGQEDAQSEALESLPPDASQNDEWLNDPDESEPVGSGDDTGRDGSTGQGLDDDFPFGANAPETNADTDNVDDDEPSMFTPDIPGVRSGEANLEQSQEPSGPPEGQSSAPSEAQQTQASVKAFTPQRLPVNDPSLDAPIPPKSRTRQPVSAEDRAAMEAATEAEYKKDQQREALRLAKQQRDQQFDDQDFQDNQTRRAQWWSERDPHFFKKEAERGNAPAWDDTRPAIRTPLPTSSELADWRQNQDRRRMAKESQASSGEDMDEMYAVLRKEYLDKQKAKLGQLSPELERELTELNKWHAERNQPDQQDQASPEPNNQTPAKDEQPPASAESKIDEIAAEAIRQQRSAATIAREQFGIPLREFMKIGDRVTAKIGELMTAPAKQPSAERAKAMERAKQLQQGDLFGGQGDIPTPDSRKDQSPPKPSPQKATPTKEPWQMLAKDFIAGYQPTGSDKTIAQMEAAHKLLKNSQTRKLSLDAIRKAKMEASKAHEDHIRKAIGEGKPVPPSVLRLYPNVNQSGGNASATPTTQPSQANPTPTIPPTQKGSQAGLQGLDEESLYQSLRHAVNAKTRPGTRMPATIPDVLDHLEEYHPDVKREQWHNLLQKWRGDERLNLHSLDNASLVSRPNEAMPDGNQSKKYFVGLNENHQQNRTPLGKLTKSVSPEQSQKNESLYDAMGEAHDRLKQQASRIGGIVKIPELHDEMVKKFPGLSQKEFHGLLKEWQKDDRINLGVVNDRHLEPRSSESLHYHEGGSPYLYISKNENHPRNKTRPPATPIQPQVATPANTPTTEGKPLHERAADDPVWFWNGVKKAMHRTKNEGGLLGDLDVTSSNTFGSKRLIADVWREFAKDNPGVSLKDFKKALVAQEKDGIPSMTRLDLVSAIPDADGVPGYKRHLESQVNLMDMDANPEDYSGPTQHALRLQDVDNAIKKAQEKMATTKQPGIPTPQVSWDDVKLNLGMKPRDQRKLGDILHEEDIGDNTKVVVSQSSHQTHPYVATVIDNDSGFQVGSVNFKTKEEAINYARQNKQMAKDSSASAPTKPTDPHLALTDELAGMFGQGKVPTANELFEAANKAHGGTRAEGKYGQSDAYDSLEAAYNKHLMGKTDPTVGLEEAQQQANELKAHLDQFPTQTNRSGNKDSFQQFSTPPHYAYAANWVANHRQGDQALEPSAGTGSLAVHAHNAGVNLHTNELDDRRAAFLRHLFGTDSVHAENADHVSAILPKRGVKDLDTVVMNPPFSQTAGRLGDKKDLQVAPRHIDEGLNLLKQGGRLVAIVGRGMSPDSPTYREWFDKIKKNHTLRANVAISGDEYKKYGTQFGTRMLVIDKNGPHQGETVTGDAEDIPDLMKKLEGVRNDRYREDQPASGQPTGGQVPSSNEGTAGPVNNSSVATNDPLANVGGAKQHAGVPAVSGGNTGSGDSADGRKSGVGGQPVGAGLRNASAGDGQGSQPTGAAIAPAKTSRRTSSGAKRGKNATGSGGNAGGESVSKPASEPVRLRPPERLAVSKPEPQGGSTKPAQSTPTTPTGVIPTAASEQGKNKNSDLGSSLYENYSPSQLHIPGMQKHKASLVESAAMAAIRAPKPKYQPHLSPDVVEKGLLSDAQLESVVYAGQAHSRMMGANEKGEGGKRRGFFIGDGTGVGKGRQIVGIIADNMNQGRKKHVWITEKQSLLNDAARDWQALGMDPKSLFHFDDLRSGKAPPDGVCFMTYGLLRQAAAQGKKSNHDILTEWLGKDHDGVIVFDEAHAMGNAIDIDEGMRKKTASKTAGAGLDLQNHSPNSRMCYVSATGATEITNLAYADRLGLWGQGTAFPDKRTFFDKMKQGGVAALECVAQNLKAMGSYMSRSISLNDGTPEGTVEFGRVTHKLLPHQEEMYNALADGWQTVLQNVDKALESTGGSKVKGHRAETQFWADHQRFFNQVLTSMQTQSVIERMEDDLKNGRAPVVQLVSTGAANLEKAKAKRKEDEEDDDLDVSPAAMLQNFIEKSFPTERYEEYTDEDGNKRMRVARERLDPNDPEEVKNPKGEPIHDPAALKLKQDMLAHVESLKRFIPESPIDQILNHFGHDQVAEITSRKQRLLRDESGKRSLVNREDGWMTSEAADFQAGKRKILIFSNAGGTGSSYHADRNAANQNQRSHYVLQPGWQADKAVQGLGRTHRTNQSSAPKFHLVEIDRIPSQKRFVSTIARRLDQLGALTKGQRQAGSSGLFSAADNLESQEAKDALEAFKSNLANGAIEGLDHKEVMKQFGFLSHNEDATRNKDAAKKMEDMNINKFLNRMLSMRVDMQNQVFSAFDKHLQDEIERAKRNDTMDVGVENFPAESMKMIASNLAHRDPETEAEANHLVMRTKNRNEKLKFADSMTDEDFMHHVRHKETGRVYAVEKSTPRTDPKTGEVREMVKLIGPDKKSNYLSRNRVNVSATTPDSSEFEYLTPEAAQADWADEYKNIPDHYEKEEHFIAGAFLPIWNLLPNNERPRIYRLRTEDGQTMVARHIPKAAVQQTLKNLNLSHDKRQYNHEELHDKLKTGRATVDLTDNWKLRTKKVQGERRIELTGPHYGHERTLTNDGVMKERINYQDRYFIPTGREGKEVLRRLLAHHQVVDVNDQDG